MAEIKRKRDGNREYYFVDCPLPGPCRWGWTGESERFDPSVEEQQQDAYADIKRQVTDHLQEHEDFNNRGRDV